MSYVGLGNLLSCGNTDLYIKVPDDSDVKTAMNRIHCHVRRLRNKCTLSTIYGCDDKGKGMIIIHIVLEKPIEKKQRGRKRGRTFHPDGIHQN